MQHPPKGALALSRPPCPAALRRLWPAIVLAAAGLTVVPQALAQAPTLWVTDPKQPSTLPDWSAALAPSAATAPELPASVEEAIRRWLAANRAVGEFSRGHIDLLRWEQAQSTDSPTPPQTPLLWADVWSQVQRQHADQMLGPQATEPERMAAQRQWLALKRQAQALWAKAITRHALLRLQQERLHAARTAHTLGERMAALGHWSRARFIPVQQTLAQEHAAAIAAQWQARQSLEALAGLMGLWQADAVQALALRLPPALDTPPQTTPPANAEGAALHQRPELQWQSDLAQRQQKSVGTEQWARWSRELDIALQQAGGDQAPQWPMSALRNDHALEKALAAHTALQRDTAALRSLVRQAWDQLQAAQAIDSLQHQQLLPLAEATEQETLLRYNGMLQSTWEVIDTARARLGTQADALQARQALWLAHIDWHILLAGGDIDPPGGPTAAGNNSAGNAAKGH
jgi:hypothetical protein